MIPAGVVTAARVTHESGGVDDLAAASPDSQRDGVDELLSVSGIEEAYVLSTCNRVEAYVVGSDAAVGRAALEEFFATVDDDAVIDTGHDESLRHLLSVAAGLESVVLGEDQIIGQVRTAYEDARDAGGIGEMLEAAVTKAIHVGERARTETEINEGVVSLGSAATTLAARNVSLEGATALVVGAGEMGRLTARSLVDTGVDEVVVANRTVSHAEHLATEIERDSSSDIGDETETETETDAIPLSALSTVASDADVVVAATGSDEPVLESHHLERASDDESGGTADETERVIVDLGQPRDVAPAAADLSDVTVYDLDDLESITRETREQRADAAREVESMVDHEYDLLCDQYKRARADEVIAAMYASAERMKQREVETALSRLEGEEFSAEQREVVEAMADALVNQLLAPPTKSLRDAAAEDDWSTINTALQLFDPDFSNTDGPFAPPINAGASTNTGAETGTGTGTGTGAHLEATDDD
ncbi:glutamyl-tRNA reductase [Natronolimnohabitans innermongolicus]|uniref:Glutamyl-tRNA reductase n=1 Tax=Natronolimnohabitans innermongolicus JCM 12255 TaxID=1227499 RepID=L9WVC3_9EURY|nr:glutamyl-tRNA reductase [Natronolimnohabitans innermongolicus]ELY53131.1 glutamyl-tRNA reductase [Natronolimnohabitans innermongolicus JCM 12255]